MSLLKQLKQCSLPQLKDWMSARLEGLAACPHPLRKCCCQHPPAALLGASVLWGSVLMDSDSYSGIKETNFPEQFPWSWFPVWVQHKPQTACTVPLIAVYIFLHLFLWLLGHPGPRKVWGTQTLCLGSHCPAAQDPWLVRAPAVTPNPSSDTEHRLVSLSFCGKCLCSSTAPPKPRLLSAVPVDTTHTQEQTGSCPGQLLMPSQAFPHPVCDHREHPDRDLPEGKLPDKLQSDKAFTRMKTDGNEQVLHVISFCFLSQ